MFRGGATAFSRAAARWTRAAAALTLASRYIVGCVAQEYEAGGVAWPLFTHLSLRSILLDDPSDTFTQVVVEDKPLRELDLRRVRLCLVFCLFFFVALPFVFGLRGS